MSTPRPRLLGPRLRRFRYGSDRLLASAGVLAFLAWMIAVGSELRAEQWAAVPIGLVMAIGIGATGLRRWWRRVDVHERGLFLPDREGVRFDELVQVIVERDPGRPNRIAGLRLALRERGARTITIDDAALDELLPVLRKHAPVRDAAPSVAGDAAPLRRALD